MADVTLDFIFKMLVANVMSMGYVKGVKQTLHTFGLNEHAGVEGYVIGIAIGILILAAILPMAFTSFYGADISHFCRTIVAADGTTTMAPDQTVISMWYLIPILIIIAIIVYFAVKRGKV